MFHDTLDATEQLRSKLEINMPQIDSIEHTISILAPIERVWNAITQADQMLEWFGTRVEIDFREGGLLVFGWDDDVNIGRIETIRKPHEFVYRWRSYTSDINTPLDDLPSTLVRFTLEEHKGGTRLTMKETGFAAFPPELYKTSLAGNTSGWKVELSELEDYLLKSLGLTPE
jgi:uncharacterized protein YndB with AHSA1/START domain